MGLLKTAVGCIKQHPKSEKLDRIFSVLSELLIFAVYTSNNVCWGDVLTQTEKHLPIVEKVASCANLTELLKGDQQDIPPKSLQTQSFFLPAKAGVTVCYMNNGN